MPALGTCGLLPLLLTSACLAADAPQVPVEAVRPPQRPVLRLQFPQEGQAYVYGASIGILGNLSVPLDANVDIRMFELRDDGGLISQGGASVQLHSGKPFTTTIFPPAAGWSTGRMIIEARLNQMRQVVARREIKIGGPEKPDRNVPRPTYDAPSSGLTFDVDDGPNVVVVPPGQRFLVTGTLPRDPLFAGAAQGPPCIGELTTPLLGGGKHVHDNALTIPLPHAGNRWWYEVELRAPEKAGRYDLRILPLGLKPPRPLTLVVGESVASR